MKGYKFEVAKEKYESIRASDKLKLEVNNMFNKKVSVLKISIGTVAVAMFAFTVALNVNPVFASTMAKNQLIKPLIIILTGNRYEFNQNNMVAKVDTPIISGIKDKEIESKINEEIEEMSKQLIADFEKEAKDLKEFDEDAHLGLEADYSIKTDNDDVLAIDLYVINTVGSSSTKHKFYNINKHTGEIILLKDKFDKNENYLETISKYIKKEMERQNSESEYDLYFATYDEIYKIVSEKEPFYINEKGNVVIVFDKYEVGPGSTGCPEFEIEE